MKTRTSKTTRNLTITIALGLCLICISVAATCYKGTPGSPCGTPGVIGCDTPVWDCCCFRWYYIPASHTYCDGAWQDCGVSGNLECSDSQVQLEIRSQTAECGLCDFSTVGWDKTYQGTCSQANLTGDSCSNCGE